MVFRQANIHRPFWKEFGQQRLPSIRKRIMPSAARMLGSSVNMRSYSANFAST
jgi:hypothetical protein